MAIQQTKCYLMYGGTRKWMVYGEYKKKKHGFEAQNKLKFFIGEEYWAFTGD